jgi:hypothetical protein
LKQKRIFQALRLDGGTVFAYVPLGLHGEHGIIPAQIRARHDSAQYNLGACPGNAHGLHRVFKALGKWSKSDIWHPYDLVSRFLGRKARAGDAGSIVKRA